MNLQVDSTQLYCAALYTFACAFRSAFPRADLQRIVIVDHFLSAVVVGRSVATIGELGYAYQLALFFAIPSVFPILIVAEIFSWYAIITDRPWSNFTENFLWTVCAAMIVVKAYSYGSVLVPVFGLVYIVFMTFVDLPMYLRRQLNRDPRKPYRDVTAGIKRLSDDWIVTTDIRDWNEEMLWMAGYFSLGVWSSLAMACDFSAN